MDTPNSQFLGNALYPLTDPEKWAGFYGLDIKIIVCTNCHEKLLVDVPFALKGIRGFCSPVCECGHQNKAFQFVKYQ